MAATCLSFVLIKPQSGCNNNYVRRKFVILASAYNNTRSLMFLSVSNVSHFLNLQGAIQATKV